MGQLGIVLMQMRTSSTSTGQTLYLALVPKPCLASPRYGRLAASKELLERTRRATSEDVITVEELTVLD